MNKEDIMQIKNIIDNFTHTHEVIPFFEDLEKHKSFGPMFENLSIEDKKIVEEIILEYIIETINGPKTKGGQLFKRFFENNKDLFRTFRELNKSKNNINKDEFQKTGELVEKQIFNLENILTQNMLKRTEGLGKTVESFYSIVYKFFPLYGDIK